MAVSKRLRYEILRRDDHACRYCGGIAPDVVLTVDHVVPVALGGSDDPSNLVAACRDCNAGKSSAAAHPQTVADVTDDAVRWSVAMQRAFDDKLAEVERVNGYLAEFESEWNGWHYKSTGKPIPLPSDWERSVEKWYALGLPFELLQRAIRGAMNKRGLSGYDAEFRYMAGIVWSTITDMEAQAAAMLAPPKRDPHECTDPWCCVHADDGPACTLCGKTSCQWLCAFYAGLRNGSSDVNRANRWAIDAYEFLSMTCDSRVVEPFLVELDEMAGA